MNTKYNQKFVLLFDGICNFCNGTVNFIIKRDHKDKFCFASLQSNVGQELLKTFNLPTNDFDTFVLVEGKKYYIKSTAALKVLKKLGGVWSFLYILIIIPRPLRDIVYNLIAKNRYKWFGKKEQCILPAPDIKKKFL